MAAPSRDGRLAAMVEHVLAANWRSGSRDGVPYAYTAPSPGRYPWQWYWDSCFCAIARRRLHRGRARAELESLLAAAEPDGFIGHTIFWGEPVDRVRRAFYNVRSRRDRMTRTIQPPLLAWAWRIAVGDPADVPAIGRHQDWVERHRDLDGDGLLWIVQPDESGMDAAPQFDRIWGLRADAQPGFPLLVHRNRRCDWDLRRVLAAGGPVVCEPATNTLHGLSRLALGRPSVTPALVDRLYDERRGRFRTIALPAPAKAADGPEPLAWGALAPLALPDLPEPIGRRLVEEHVLRDGRFRLPVPPPSVAGDDPAFTVSDRRLGLRRYWGGPTWINAAWLTWLGLVRLGYEEAAADMAARLVATVAREGLREYYDPFTGAGMGAEDFAWSALIAELAWPEPAAASSHLG